MWASQPWTRPYCSVPWPSWSPWCSTVRISTTRWRRRSLLDSSFHIFRGMKPYFFDWYPCIYYLILINHSFFVQFQDGSRHSDLHHRCHQRFVPQSSRGEETGEASNMADSTVSCCKHQQFCVVTVKSMNMWLCVRRQHVFPFLFAKVMFSLSFLPLTCS